MSAHRRPPKRPGATVPVAALGTALLAVALVLMHATSTTRASCGGLAAGPCGDADLRYDGGMLLAGTGVVLLGGALVAAYGRTLALRRADARRDTTTPASDPDIDLR